MEKVFVAGRRLKIGDDLRFPGDPVPEVALFTERQKRVLLNTGHVILKGLDELNPDQHEKLSQYLEKMRQNTLEAVSMSYLLDGGSREKKKPSRRWRLLDFF